MLLPKNPLYSCISSMIMNRSDLRNLAPSSVLFHGYLLPKKDRFKYSGLVNRICEGCCRRTARISSPVSPS